MSRSLHQPDISIALIEDDPGLREELRVWLEREDRIQCIGVFASTERALAALGTCKPDIWLVDINLPGQSGIVFVTALQQRGGKAKALILTAYDDSDLIFEALKAGASGYLLKRHAAAQLRDAIHQLNNGGAPMSPEIASQVVAYFHLTGKRKKELESISPREREILQLLSQGHAYKEIAARLDLSLDTVRTYLKRIYDKLHVHSRTEAVVKYLGN
jgi:DNA-binding NarL/FixJ family response regulator